MSNIEWTQKTWNPIAGCSKVSSGCANCYAEVMSGRLAHMGQTKYQGLTVLQGRHARWTGKIAFDEHALLEPLRRKTPTTYFVNSMSDLFHDGVTDEMLGRIYAVMLLSPQHTFQVLTKRPERRREYFRQIQDERDMQRWIQHADEMGVAMRWTDWPGPEWPLPNVWEGVSIEDQPTADKRVPVLIDTQRRCGSSLPSLCWVISTSLF